ncbi:V-type ATPase subunit [Jeotgalibaca ciconiae]|uniref:V-type ATP synthase subunit C n=1 Tax=Jeotgalibaca ciconiae TaxID=2496265 RepID=A0A3Q9BN17_9LACT|nr:V-type ATPase subunit [Jeotgalibaca ciconiae]AZP05194.1 V-type ATP synthase subunit C [Jeotgalibaca ciconiae]
MRDTDYKGINTLIRTYELRLLKTEDFERMIKADDLASALDVLKGTDYEFDQAEVLRTKDFNQFAMNHLANVYRELYELAPTPELIDLFTLRYTYHNLKVLLKQYILKENYESLLIPIGHLSIDSLKNLVETGESDVAHPIMVEAVQSAKSDYEERGLIEAVTVYMDTYYFRHLRAITNEIDYSPITNITDTLIDLYNLTSVVRSLNQGKPRSHLYALLSSSGSISKQDIIDESMNGAVSVLRKLYSGMSYGSQLETVIEDNNRIDTLKLDKLMDDLIHQIVSEGIYQAFGPLPLLGYIYAKETEVTNLRLILVGKDNEIEEEKLRERVRKVYGS